ncbi:MAG: hypothetical protein ABIT38_23355, partial [Gemmatimonadaceae bacterium]
MWESAGERVHHALTAVAAVAVLGDDPVATAAATLGIARAQARHRRVFVTDLLGDGSPLSTLVPSDDLHGVSDMVNFGVSLGRAARAVPGMPNLYVVLGGAESPLTDEILGAPWWSALFDQVKRSGALLLLAAPSIVPSIDRLVARSDGVILVGDAVAGERELGVPLLGEVRAPTALRLPAAQPKSAAASRATVDAPSSKRWIWAALVLALLGGGAVFVVPRWSEVVALLTGGRKEATPIPPPLPTSAAPAVAAPTAATSGTADYGVQFLYLNSAQEANAILARNADSLPAAT